MSMMQNKKSNIPKMTQKLVFSGRQSSRDWVPANGPVLPIQTHLREPNPEALTPAKYQLLSHFGCRCFTLLEICIVMVILSLIGGYFGAQGWQIVQNHRFQTSVDDFARHLRARQMQSACYQEDVSIYLFQSDQGVFYTEDPKKKGKRMQMPGVSYFTQGGKKKMTIPLHIFSTGVTSSMGPVTFFCGKRSMMLSMEPPFSIFKHEVSDETNE